jgi:hypothetical protein
MMRIAKGASALEFSLISSPDPWHTARLLLMAAMVSVCSSGYVHAQSANATPVIPQQIRATGSIAGHAGASIDATFRIYAEEKGGEALWAETQRVSISADGSYAALLGAVSENGLPLTVFAAGQARWLGVSVTDEQELPRTLLVSVPYAMKSADSANLGGRAASDYVTREELQPANSSNSANSAFSPLTGGTVTGTGTANYVPLWTGALTQGNSNIYQSGSLVGVNTATPLTTLDVNGTLAARSDLREQTLSPATTSSGQASPSVELIGNTYNSTAAASQPVTFAFKEEPQSNNTASPTGTLDLLYGEGTSALTPALTGLSFNPNGTINFAPGQGFSTNYLTAATSSVAQNSGNLTFKSSAWSSTTSAAVAQAFDWKAVASGNNTASPTGNLTLFTGSGPGGSAGSAANPSATGLSIAPTGVITFASGQTFPGPGGGTITSVSTGSPLTGGATAGAVSLGLDTSALETTLNSQYAQLAFSNTFTTGQIIEGASVISGTNISGPMLQVTNSGDSFSSAISAANGGQYGIGISVSASNNGFGIEGFGTQTGGSIGILGALANSNGFSNSFFLLESDDGLDAGLWADGATGQESALIATADDDYAGIFYNDSATSSTILALNNNSGGTTGLDVHAIGTVLRAGGPGGSCGINQTGNLACTGQVKTLVTTKSSARQVETYSVQSAENWLEDYGSGQLSHGSVTVALDPAFAETVNTGVEFHVFLTPGGDCKGLYVSNKTANSFEVHELGGGTSSISFDYKIVAKRLGHENERLVDVTDRMRLETEAARLKPLADGPAKTMLRQRAKAQAAKSIASVKRP